ncbi:glycosyl transferase [Bacillus cereus]|nr:glycosyl transferase [Bacillus cereus]
MKVIMIGSHLRVTGGITRVVKNYIKAGLNKKVNLEYFPSYYGSNHLINIVFFVFQYIKLFIKLVVLKQTYDIAHIHMSYKGSFIRKACIINLCSKVGIPIIVHMHGGYFKQFYFESSESRKKKIICTLNKADVLIALGDEWKSYYESICDTRVISIENAVFPKNYGLSDNEKIYITAMGLLSAKKGTYDLIKVAERLNGKIDPKYKFVLAGDGEVDQVKKKINHLNLEDLFMVPGWVSDEKIIDEIYSKSILYILPSYFEGMPMSILEAMSYGLPIISTNVGSIAGVVREENGVIVEPGNIDGMEKAILHLLNEPEKIKKMHFNNIKKIESQYNIYNGLDQIITLYQEVKS